MSRITIRETEDENRLRCTCGGERWLVNLEGEGRSDGSTVNSAECVACHRIYSVHVELDASPDSGEASRLADELDKLSSSHRPLLTAAANELRRLAADPSPEAPANRQEAGEVWRSDMDNAPRDASRLLIATPDGRVCEAWWAHDYEGGPGYWSTPPSVSGRGYTILPDYPTHWRPMPASPFAALSASNAAQVSK